MFGPTAAPRKEGRQHVPERSFHHPVTPDGRYFVVRGRLWRMSNPNLSEKERTRLVSDLMAARRAVRMAREEKNAAAMRRSRAAVDRAKRGLGERGPGWWSDGAPDLNRRMAVNTDYADWFRALGSE